ncbi:RDD family protein [Cellulomonas sp. HZM]|uniref:RDD family protein n=1 Tax=Cellulomonas sp. HZM TaxID=1454010 RepID=UPI000493B424|nr:RDD family protein [Cellulomonas sp. HZM]
MVTDGILTGEGVVLDTHAASAPSRILAGLIDVVAIFAVLLVGTIVANSLLQWNPSGSAARILTIVLIVTVLVVLPVTVETLTRGRSLGKLVAGIRVVRDDGGPVVFRQSFVRALTGIVELWITFGSIAIICSIVHPKGKRVGDILAGTYAIRVRGAKVARALPGVPAYLWAWSRTAEVGRLPDGLALAVRQFLSRAHMLHQHSRVELGSRLTAEVGRYVQPPPPIGAHPEEFLAAVLAVRRDTELRIAAQDAARDERDAAGVRRLPHGVPDPVD